MIRIIAIAWIAALLACSASAKPTAIKPVSFGTRVDCDIESGHFELYKSAAVDKVLSTPGASVSGRLGLTSAHGDPKWVSAVSLVVGDAVRFTAIDFAGCKLTLVCESARFADIAAKRQDRLQSSGVFLRTQPIPFTITVVSRTEWAIRYGSDHNWTFKVDGSRTHLLAECVGAKGWIEFDLGPPAVS